jgi:rubrerythrin
MKVCEKLRHSKIEQAIPMRMAENWNKGSSAALPSETTGSMLEPESKRKEGTRKVTKFARLAQRSREWHYANCPKNRGKAIQTLIHRCARCGGALYRFCPACSAQWKPAPVHYCQF